jgi:hypothetical protein
MLKPALAAASLLLLTLRPATQNVSQPAPAPSAVTDAPAYTAAGKLIAPAHYREWIYLTSGLDMSYTSSTAPADMHRFDNVFVNPAAYRAFVATGTWPDKTTFILEVRGAQNPVSINKRGNTQSTEIMGTEIHFKDHGVWSFYDLPPGKTEADLIPRTSACDTCHEAHAAVDTTFVQFYPTLLPIATAKKTLSAAYLHDPATLAPQPAK